MTTDVDLLILNAKSYATATAADAGAAVQAATAIIGTIGAKIDTAVSPPPNVVIPAPPTLAELVEFQDIIVGAVSAPDSVTGLVNVPSLDFGATPLSSLTAPSFVDPPRPSQFQPRTLTPPAITTTFVFPTLPDALSASLVAPVIADRTAPAAPQVIVPTFGSTAPTFDGTVLPDPSSALNSAYSSASASMAASSTAQFTAAMTLIDPGFAAGVATIEARIAALLGGAVLVPGVEDAIFSRAQGKLNAEYLRARAAAFGDAARRGFTIPDGAQQSATQAARQAASDNNARAATDVAVKQAELSQQNMQAGLAAAVSMRSAMAGAAASIYSSSISLSGQATDYAKAAVSAMVSAYGLTLDKYKALLEGYKADASVYEVRMRGTMAVIEVYRAAITGFEAEVRADDTKMNVFRSRVESLNALVGVYRGQIDAVVSQASLEKLKIELFGETVRAYGVEAQAKQSEWQGYTAALGGNEARARVFTGQVESYRAQVDAYRTSIEAKRAAIEASTSFNEGQVRQYVARVDGYRALVGAEGQLATTKVAVQQAKLHAVTAKYGAQEWQAKVAQAYYQANITMGIEKYRAETALKLGSAELYVKQISSVAQTTMDGARVYESLAAAAMSGMNTIVSSAISA